MNVIIREITDSTQKSAITEKIIRSLPDWFELENGIVEYINGVKNKGFFVAFDKDIAIGFVAIENHNKWTSEIYVMGVLPDKRSQGVGSELINYSWDKIQKSGRKYLIVKTLDSSANDKFYAETQEFYKKVGFTPLFTSTKIWNPENPCLVMIKDKP